MMQNMQDAELKLVLERMEIIERKLDALLNALIEEETETRRDPLASLSSLDQGQPLDLESDWATL